MSCKAIHLELLIVPGSGRCQDQGAVRYGYTRAIHGRKYVRGLPSSVQENYRLEDNFFDGVVLFDFEDLRFLGRKVRFVFAGLSFFLQSNSAIIFFSSALAALCHPQIALLSLVLLECARFMLLQRPRISSVAGALAGFILVKLGLHASGFGDAAGRFEYTSKFLPELVLGGALNAVSFAVMSIAPCMLLFLASGVLKPPGFWLSKLNVVPFIACLSLITTICVFLTFDRSRVFTLLTFPAYALLLHTYKEELFAFFLSRTLMGYLIALLMLVSPQTRADRLESVVLHRKLP